MNRLLKLLENVDAVLQDKIANITDYREAKRLAKAAVERAIVEQKTLIRYCPDCGSIGPVSDKPGVRDCCPDGSHAYYVPPAIARQAHNYFLLKYKLT